MITGPRNVLAPVRASEPTPCFNTPVAPLIGLPPIEYGCVPSLLTVMLAGLTPPGAVMLIGLLLGMLPVLSNVTAVRSKYLAGAGTEFCQFTVLLMSQTLLV